MASLKNPIFRGREEFFNEFLKAHGYQVQIVDICFPPGSLAHILRMYRPRLVAVSCLLILDVEATMQHDQEIRKEAPEIFISTGNHSIGSFPKALNGVVGIDTNCVDEGKNTLSGLCDAVAQQTPISEIPTLLLPKGPGTFLATGKNRALLDMNQVLPPDRKGVAKYRTIYLCLNYMPVRTLDEEAN